MVAAVLLYQQGGEAICVGLPWHKRWPIKQIVKIESLLWKCLSALLLESAAQEGLKCTLHLNAATIVITYQPHNLWHLSFFR